MYWVSRRNTVNARKFSVYWISTKTLFIPLFVLSVFSCWPRLYALFTLRVMKRCKWRQRWIATLQNICIWIIEQWQWGTMEKESISLSTQDFSNIGYFYVAGSDYLLCGKRCDIKKPESDERCVWERFLTTVYCFFYACCSIDTVSM